MYGGHDDDESDNHDETKLFTCDHHDDDEIDKSLAIKRCYNGGDESDKSLAINARTCFPFPLAVESASSAIECHTQANNLRTEDQRHLISSTSSLVCQNTPFMVWVGRPIATCR